MNDSRTTKATKNIIYGISNQVVLLLLSFINRTIFIHTLGVNYLGINGLFSDVLAMLSLADLGFSTAMVYSFYNPLAEADNNKLAALITFYKKVYNIIAFAVLSLGLICIPFLKYIINTDMKISNLTIYYIFFLANSVVSYIYVYKTFIISADQKNYIVTRYNTILNILRIAIQALLLYTTKSYLLYIAVQVIITFLLNYISSKKADNLYPFINEKQMLGKIEKKEIYNSLKSVFLYKISIVMINSTDNILISMLLGTVYVGYYSNYYLITRNLSSFVTVIFSSLTYSIGNVIAKEGPGKRREVFNGVQSLSFCIASFVAICFICLINDFIFLWLGTKFLLDIITVVAITINLYLGFVLQPILAYREAAGLYVKTKYIMLIAAGINLIFSIILGRYIGLAGILFASAIACLLTYFWYEPRILFQDYFNCKVRLYYFVIIKNVIFTIIIVIILNSIFYRFHINSWIGFIVKALSVVLISGVAIYILYRKSEGVNIIRSRLKLLR